MDWISYVWKLSRRGVGAQLFVLGLVFGTWTADISAWWVFAGLVWAMFPGFFLFAGFNDAYDIETDSQNPRKRTLELAAKDTQKTRLILLSFFSIISLGLFYPIATPTLFLLACVLVASNILYSVPPFRCKTIPGLNVLFGGIGTCLPISLMGYVLVSSVLPPVEFILLASLHMIAVHIAFGDALDYESDKAAGINTIAVWIGSAKRALYLAVSVWAVATLYALYMGLFVVVFAICLMILYTLYEILKNKISERSVLIFQNMQRVSFVGWFLIVTWYIWTFLV